MRELGSVFREIRIGKNMKIKEVASGIVTESTISQFEKNKTSISLSVFLKLIERLNVTLEEYCFLVNGLDHMYPQVDFFNQLEKYTRSRSAFSIHADIKGELESYQTDKNIRHIHNVELLKYLPIPNKSNTNVPREESAIFSYLINCESWGLYELNLFYYSCIIFSCNDLLYLLKIALRKADHFEKLFFVGNLGLKTRIKVVSVLLNNPNNESLDVVHKLLVQIKHLLLESSLMDDKNSFNFYKGIYYIFRGKFEYGIKLCEQSIDTLSALDMISEASIFQKYLESTLNKVPVSEFTNSSGDMKIS